MRPLIFVTLIVLAAIWIEKYRYDDCKKVGHTTFYCILNMGK